MFASGKQLTILCGKKARKPAGPVGNFRRARSASSLVAAALAVPLTITGAGSVVRAGASYWNFGTGFWTNPTAWVNGEPVGGTDAYIEHTDNLNRTVYYDYTGGSIQFNSLQVDHAGNGSTTFEQYSSNTFNVLNEVIGDSAYARWHLSAGTHNVNNDITFGSQISAVGICFLDGGTLNVAHYE